MFLQVDDRELATILAGLRFWQAVGLTSPWRNEHSIATDDGKFEPFDSDELDELCERVNCESSTLPEKLQVALERATAACDAHTSGGKIDYDWIGEAEDALKAASAAGLPKVSSELKRLLMAEIDNEDGDQPATLETVLESLDSGYEPSAGFPVKEIRREITALIESAGNAPADRFVTDADWAGRAK